MQRLYTKEGEGLKGMPWMTYPRPQMRREQWLCLNGEWDFETEGGERCKIRVPFCPESLLSGYEGSIRYGEVLRYERNFDVPEAWLGKRILLHFGAVCRQCEVAVNGKSVCTHENAYLPFSADVTELVEARGNRLAVSVKNDLSTKYPWGKQREKRGGMWYTPVSGIWQTVWMEPVPETYVERVCITQDERGTDIVLVSSDRANASLEGEAFCEGKRYAIKDGRVRVEPENPEPWTPETPRLYEVRLQIGEDEVTTYFALRSLSVKEVGGHPRLCLNGKPYFFHGLLDQGYYSDGLYTPAAPQLYEQDILRMKALGFNTLRKHIKVEPEQFYYDCDRLGMIVFQDMVNNGKYHFLHDTAFPTVGFLKYNDLIVHRNGKTREEFLKAMRGTVEHLSSHPCIVYWTIFNEGWGQFDADGAYGKLKALDDSRFIDATSGWFHRNKSDVDSLHIYFGSLHLGKERNLPQVLSEFGGYVYKLPEHSYNQEKTHGYKIFASREAMVNALRKVYLEKILPLAKEGLCGAVYTQVSDVEDETNGIVTYDRRVIKILPEEFADIAERLQEAVYAEEA